MDIYWTFFFFQPAFSSILLKTEWLWIENHTMGNKNDYFKVLKQEENIKPFTVGNKIKLQVMQREQKIST